MTKNIHFIKDGDNYEVQSWKDAQGYDWDTLGALEFDDDQGAWVFWQAESGQGVTYFDSLEDTEETLKDELNN